MSFRETLEQICARVPGAVAASVMGYDGIAVETIEAPEASERLDGVNVTSAMIEYSNIFGQIRQAAAQLEAGDAHEFSLRAEKIVAVGRAITDEYFLVLALRPDGNQGKARYAVRVGASEFVRELT